MKACFEVCFDKVLCVLNDKYELIYISIEFYCILDLRYKLCDL
jgi:hypothetical protein